MEQNLEVLTVQQDGIATITINRPDKLNALNLTTVRKIDAALQEIQGNADIRVVVIRGAECKAFVAGADIEDFASMTPAEFHQYICEIMRMGQHISELRQPVIAAVDGFCLGGGCTITLACDLVIATKRSKFGVLESNLGFTGNGSALARLVGKQVASELTMLAPIISAERAYELHLVNRLVESSDFDGVVQELSKKLCEKSPASLQWTKRIIRRALDAGLNDAIDYEADAALICFQTPECSEAIEQFINKGR